MPYAIWYAYPEIALVIFIQPIKPAPDTTIFSVTMHTIELNRTQDSQIAARSGTGPHDSATILKELQHIMSGKLRVLSQPAILPARQPSPGTDPECSIPRREETEDVVRRKMLARWFPRYGSNAIEAKQAEFRAEPEITIAGLRDRVDPAPGEALADSPGCVCILAEVESGI